MMKEKDRPEGSAPEGNRSGESAPEGNRSGRSRPERSRSNRSGGSRPEGSRSGRSALEGNRSGESGAGRTERACRRIFPAAIACILTLACVLGVFGLSMVRDTGLSRNSGTGNLQGAINPGERTYSFGSRENARESSAEEIGTAGEESEAAEAKTGADAEEAAEAKNRKEAAEAKTGADAEEAAETAATAENAGLAGTEAADSGRTGREKAAARSAGMDALDKKLRKQLSEKSGEWSLYLYRLDTGEEIGVNAGDSMISASLIKLYVAGAYLEQVEKNGLSDDYQNQLFYMLSASDNGSTNTLIDLLGMDQINEFMKQHHYREGQLNRKMLVKNGTENYTSARDCGRVLRKAFRGTYVSKEASERVLDAMRAQIGRNRGKIPAGVPGDVGTANKTGELFTANAEGVYVNVQNDAAVVFDEEHPYVLVVMSAVPGAGEGELHRQIAEISAEVYSAVCEEE